MRRPNPLAPEPHVWSGAAGRSVRAARPRPDPAPRPAVKPSICCAWRKFATHPARPERSCETAHDGEPHDRPDPRPPGRAEDHAAARAEGRSGATLFGTEPPRYNRRYLESRLAYRIQELAYGGLKPETIRRLEALGEQFDDGNVTTPPHPPRRHADRRHPADPRVAGRRAHRHGAGRRLRVAGPALPVALGHRPRHHRHPLERLVFFGLKSHGGAA